MLVVAGNSFNGWHTLDDTVMGGRSSSSCRVTSQGLSLDATVVEAGGGFVSCRSPLYSPCLNLSAYTKFQLALIGDGRGFKLAVACADGMGGLTELVPGGLRWVADFATEPNSLSQIEIPFTSLTPTIRAKPVQALPLGLPLRFDSGRITRLQLLHSKFSDDGGLNPQFRPGPLHLEVHSIHAIP